MNAMTLPLRRFGLVLTAWFALGGPGRAEPAAATTWESADFHAVVSGTSTLHDWAVESRQAGGELRCTAENVSGRLIIVDKSLSGGPPGLNEKMYAALKADKFPVITFEAGDVPRISGAEAASLVSWPVQGRLTIAGVTREVALQCRLSTPAAGRFVLETETELKMTDYGLKPPTFMGLVRTGDVVKVKIRWELRPSAASTD